MVRPWKLRLKVSEDEHPTEEEVMEVQKKVSRSTKWRAKVQSDKHEELKLIDKERKRLMRQKLKGDDSRGAKLKKKESNAKQAARQKQYRERQRLKKFAEKALWTCSLRMTPNRLFKVCVINVAIIYTFTNVRQIL